MTDQVSHNAPPLGVILAGGRSSRMGGKDKFLIELGGKKILDHIIERLEPQVDRLIINANRELDTSLEVVPDLVKGHGPLGGLYSALRFAKENGYSQIITVPCDTPFIPRDFASRLLEHSDKPITAAKSQGRIHPVLARWHISLLDDLKENIDNNQRKMLTWISKHPATEVSWDTPPDPFFNINRQEDLEKAERLLKKDDFADQ